MDISDYSFHDAKILLVKEITAEQAIEYLIDFPVDWEENKFEHRILRFNDVTRYTIDEIPFGMAPTILEINDLGTQKTVLSAGKSEMQFERRVAELVTNAGTRIILYVSTDLIIP